MKKIVSLFIVIILLVMVIDFKHVSHAINDRNIKFEVSEKEGNSYIIFPVTSTKASAEIGLRWETEAYKITMFPKGTQININGEEDHKNCPIENMKDQIVIDQSIR
ncbi:hypothetical protein [Defluviitalea phaphyphila]|uniref:hypothetical protein n=1 Tax=Defluviitalea phaphyphila TaxID=1473580 RepID=UPI000731309B|nr:hypothetical protein [Defluviitalea phaphyphila]